MSRSRPHYFASNTPDPAGATTSPIDELLQLIQVWLAFAAVCAVLAAAIAFFCPSLFILFR